MYLIALLELLLGQAATRMTDRKLTSTSFHTKGSLLSLMSKHPNETKPT